MAISKLKKVLKEKNIDLALVYNIDSESFNRNLYYLSGYRGIGLLAVPKDKLPFLIVPGLEKERAEHSSKIKVYTWEKGKRLFEQMKEVLIEKKIKPKTLGIVERDFSYDVYKSLKKYVKKVKIKNIDRDIFNIRSVKNENEINKLRKAAKLTDAITKKCIDNWHMFKTEKDVEIFLHKEAVKNGCGLSFPSIVASGKSAAMAHAEPRNKRLKKGFCVIDWGVKYEGYHADITRTIYIGKPSKKDIELYNFLLNVQNNLIKKVKLNKKCSELYEDALVMLGEYSDYFTHGLGHGIGLNIHELPNLKSVSDDVFKNNMAFTIEPGIYYEGKKGLRIEDDILISKGKVEILTKFPKKLIIKKARTK